VNCRQDPYIPVQIYASVSVAIHVVRLAIRQAPIIAQVRYINIRGDQDLGNVPIVPFTDLDHRQFSIAGFPQGCSIIVFFQCLDELDNAFRRQNAKVPGGCPKFGMVWKQFQVLLMGDVQIKGQIIFEYVLTGVPSFLNRFNIFKSLL
jgi:hypothetical protein